MMVTSGSSAQQLQATTPNAVLCTSQVKTRRIYKPINTPEPKKDDEQNCTTPFKVEAIERLKR
jgi:hypothetical protein